jgi:iron complex outermembrane receptor protein
MGVETMKNVLRGSSGAIVSMSLVAGALPAWAQETAQSVPSNSQELTEIIVTGSFIRGTPVDAALPVEVYSREELERRGSPSALDFAQSLTNARH